MTIAPIDDAPGIFACVQRERLVARALAGDRQALRIAISLLPTDLPPAFLRNERDKEIRALADWLASERPEWSRNRVAEVLAAAGRSTERGDPLISPKFRDLDRDERTDLARRIGEILEWAPTTKRGASWPGARTLNTIIGGLSVDPAPRDTPRQLRATG